MNFILNEVNKECDLGENIKVSPWKILLTVVALFGVISYILYKIVVLQFVNFGTYVKASNANYQKEIDVFPERGVIYADDLSLLVQNKPVFELVIDLNAINRYKSYSSLNDVIPVEYADVLAKHKIAVSDDMYQGFMEANSAGRSYFVLKKFFSKDDYQVINSDISNVQEDSPVLKVIPSSYREYLGGESTSHVLGYTSFISKERLDEDSWYSPNSKVGVAGLESTYEKELRGIKGEQSKTFSSTSSEVSSKLSLQPKSGNSLVTTINKDLQKVAYDSLREKVNEIDAVGGAVVVQDPNNGRVLSIASYPSYDNNMFSHKISKKDYNSLINDFNKPLLNRAISSAFPPASTFKLVTSTAGLQEKGLTTDTVITDTGVISIGDFTYKTWKAGGHGVISVVEALKESSDIFFYVVGGGHESYPQIKGVGAYNLHNYAKMFGFGHVLGIDLPGEVAGFVPFPDWKKEALNEDWYIGNTYHFSIGQGFLTSTPLQVNAMISAVANGGTVYKPIIVEKVVDSETNDVIKQNDPVEVSKVAISSENLQALREGLVQASSPGGTAYPLFNYKVTVAGKTGTAEFGTPKQDGTLPTHAWYTAYAPAEDPKIAVTVFIEDGGGGSDNAAPVVKDIFDEFFKDIENEASQ